MDEFDYTLSRALTLVENHSITGTDYRSVLHPHEPEKLVTQEEVVEHFFNMYTFDPLAFRQMMMGFHETLELLEVFFRFYMAVPFTGYEFNYAIAVDRSLWSRSLTNQQAKHILEGKASVSSATHNKLVTALVDDIDFFQESEEISDSFFEETLQKILEEAKKIWRESLNAAQRLKTDSRNLELKSVRARGNNLIEFLSRMAFFQTWELLNPTDPENRYQLLLITHLMAPLTNFINQLIGVKFTVAPHNPYGTGYDAKLANQTDSVQQAFSDVCVYRAPPAYISVLVVEAKKFPLMALLAQSYPKQGSKALAGFHLQLLTQMLTNRTNRAILTDAENAILMKINHKKLKYLRVVKQQKKRKDMGDVTSEDVKYVPLHYKLLNTHSAGITLRGGVLAFLYDSMTLSKEKLTVIAEEMEDLFNYLKLTDKEFLQKLDFLSDLEIEPIKELLKSFLPNQTIECLNQGISSFEESDIQTGFKFNTQVFKLFENDLSSLSEQISDSQVSPSMKSEGVIVVKVFDPLKSKSRSLGKPYNRNEVRLHCLKSFFRERKIYDRLQDTGFNSCYIRDQPITFFKFLINGYYHALGPCIFLKYVDHQLEKFPFGDSHYYDLAKEQLEILHSAGVSHNDISERNVLCTQYPQKNTRQVYLIDFAYSSMRKVVGPGDRSETVTEKSLIQLQEADIEDLRKLFYESRGPGVSIENESLGQS